MAVNDQTIARLARIPNIALSPGTPLSAHTRFGLGGPADVLLETSDESSFTKALRIAEESGAPYVVIGGGTNLVVADRGFAGIALKFTSQTIDDEQYGERDHEWLVANGFKVRADAGATLQKLVDRTIDSGLQGLETMTGIPGSVGGAVYGNAGAYGHSIMEFVETVRYFNGDHVCTLNNAQCEFRYRESIFKRRKDWVIFSVTLRMFPGYGSELRKAADGIRKIRDEKYPPTMKCAGSIFKNLILSELPAAARDQVPAKVVREGKVPSAWFLEQVGAKGRKRGDIHVADYHANLIYNVGAGTSADLVEMIRELKDRVREKFGFDLEEEVQYVGFDPVLG
jgi:UDP-N-acetylmuramate dehydrogenase